MGQRFSEPSRGKAWGGVVRALRRHDRGVVAYPGIIVTGETPGDIHTKLPGFYPRLRIGELVGSIGPMLRPPHRVVETDSMSSVASAGESDDRQVVVRSSTRVISLRRVHPEVLRTAVATMSAEFLAKNAIRIQIEFTRRELDLTQVDGDMVLPYSLDSVPLYLTSSVYFLDKIQMHMRPGVTAEGVRNYMRKTHVGLDTMMVGLLGADDNEGRYVAVGEDRRGYTVVEIVPRIVSLPIARCYHKVCSVDGWLAQEPVNLWWSQVSA